jgi:uncharacterized protein YpuA (DUF1002 family)
MVEEHMEMSDMLKKHKSKQTRIEEMQTISSKTGKSGLSTDSLAEMVKKIKERGENLERENAEMKDMLKIMAFKYEDESKRNFVNSINSHFNPKEKFDFEELMATLEEEIQLQT